MKTIKLLNLRLVNFKGIKEFELNAAGNNIKVFGENATGKTTIFDAFVWLLFNKDSLNKADFEIKTLVDGKPIHKLDHEVEAKIFVEDKEITLKKVYSERWTKKRGSITESFSGHTTKYYINDVPSKKKEFDDTIKDIVDEDVFKLLTNPNQFNEQLHWTDRRKLLLEIAGDITDEDVIASNKDLSKLLDALNGNSIEDHKKIIAAKRREINKEIDRIPIRIDEIHRNLPDITGLNETKIKADIDKLSFQIEEKSEQINAIKNGSETNELKKQISDIELQTSNVRNEHTQNEQQELFKLKTRHQEEQSNLTIMRGELRGLEQQKASNVSRINDFEKQMQDLREEFATSKGQYDEHNALEFNHEEECICPTCEQDLPEDKVSEAVERFNRNKSNLLERIVKRQAKINEQGKELKGKVGETNQENEALQKKVDKITDKGKKKASEIEKLEIKIKEAESNVKPIEENEQYTHLTMNKNELQQQVEQLEQSVSESVQKVQEEIAELKEQQSELQVDLSRLSQHEQSKERVSELENQEKSLASEYEELEHQLHLTEEFTRTKVNMLTENINNKFKYARFNLFKENINGGLEEVCETTYEGVPYSSGLNNAARINVGLDIINTLSEHYGVQAPIFADNSESVVEMIDTESQLIKLIVSADDKVLRVEVENHNDMQSEGLRKTS